MCISVSNNMLNNCVRDIIYSRQLVSSSEVSGSRNNGVFVRLMDVQYLANLL